MSFQVYINPKNKIMLHKKWSRQNYSYKQKTTSCRAHNDQLGMRRRMDFYEVLSLGSKNVGSDEIKKAYRSMALQYHPDVCPPSTKEESTKRFVELRQAYETLSDPISRRMYDYELDLFNSKGFAFERLSTEERKNNFPREVWERQLYGLNQRSRARKERMNNKYM